MKILIKTSKTSVDVEPIIECEKRFTEQQRLNLKRLILNLIRLSAKAKKHFSTQRIKTNPRHEKTIMTEQNNKKKKGFSRRKFLVRTVIGTGVLLGTGYLTRHMWRRTIFTEVDKGCLLYTSPSPRDRQKSRMPSSA